MHEMKEAVQATAVLSQEFVLVQSSAQMLADGSLRLTEFTAYNVLDYTKFL